MGDLFPSFEQVPSGAWRGVASIARALKKVGRVLLYVLPALILIHLIATIVTGRTLNREIDRLTAAGIIVPVDSLILVVPPDEPNAADVYQRAFDALRLSKDDDAVLFEKRGEWDPARLPLARAVVGANDEYYRLLDEASQVEHCAFAVDWDDPFGAVFPHLAQLRQAASMLDLRAQVSAADGNYDAALDDCALAVRLCKHVELEPTIISALVSQHIERMAVDSLEHLVSVGSALPPEACRRLADRLGQIDNVEHSLRGLRTEIVLFGMPAVGLLRTGELSVSDLHALQQSGTVESRRWLRTILRVPALIARPVFNLNLTAYLRHMEGQIEAFGRPWAESRQAVAGLEAGRAQLRWYHTIAHLLTPALERMLWSRDRTTAKVRAGAVALAAIAYEGERGRLPDSLAELEAAGWELPADPFGGGEFHYRRKGEGFVVWSIGPDMDDDGGTTDYDDIAASLGTESPDEYDCDIVFRVAR
jgi:hypothetical protein